MNERPSRWAPAAARDDGSPGELANATCALCGIELSIISLIPDGGPASAEVRWYCRDIVSCTERWTSDRGRRAGQVPFPDGNALEPDAEPVTDRRAVPAGDTPPVPGDAQATAEGPQPGPGGESGPAGEPDAAEGPEPAKVRAGQSGGGGIRPIG